MRRSRSIALPSLVALTAATALAAAVPVAAHAAASTAASTAAPTLPKASGPTESVTLQLTPRDPRGLARLATTRGLTQSQRITRLDAVLPGTARAEQVASLARRLGLTVAGYDELSVDVSAPASTVRALFGSARAQQPSLPTAQALPTVPSAFSGLVTVAVGGDDTRPAVKSHAIRSASLRSASSAVAPTDGSISVAQARGISRIPTDTAVPSSTGPIIASLQFPSPAVQGQTGVSNLLKDLATYANTNKIYSSTLSQGTGTSGQIVAVTPTALADSVAYPNPSNSPDCTDDTDYQDQPGGDETADEVALDQETLLTTAPQLRQRIYYAPNCGDGQYDAMKQVLFDVTNNGLPISALSTSWGECEPQVSALLSEDQSVVQMLQAAGVTVFAATGDDGSFDCTDDTGKTIAADAVDDPGSVPGVVAVGGTGGTTIAALTTWNSGGYSSGGGFSCVASGTAGFAQPSYQSTVSEAPRYPHDGYGCTTSSVKRQVPDIADDAAEGLDTVVTEIGQQQATYQIFGTSFSAPLAAGGYAQTLYALGKTGTDVQNANTNGLPGLLYAATTGFTDVLNGNNGDYSAGPGWDPTTGLGTPHWPTLLASLTGASTSNGPSSISSGQELTNGERLTSPGGNAFVQMQGDGNLVLYDYYSGGAVPIWQSHTSGNPGAFAILQGDSNLVIYASSGKAIFNASTVGLGIATLAVRDNGTLSGLSAGGVPLWATPGGRTLYGPDHVPAGGELDPGNFITSPNGIYEAQMTTTGTLTVTGGSGSAAESLSFGSSVAGSSAYVLPTGDLVVQKNGTNGFDAGAPGNPHDVLSLTNSGVLTLTAADGIIVWTSAGPANKGTLTGYNGYTLVNNQQLAPNVHVWSQDGSHYMVFQGDANLVIYNLSGHALWSSRTSGTPSKLVLQGDGNLVLYSSSGQAIFTTRTQNMGVTRAILQGDGNLVLYAPSGAKWSWETGLIK